MLLSLFNFFFSFKCFDNLYLGSLVALQMSTSLIRAIANVKFLHQHKMERHIFNIKNVKKLLNNKKLWLKFLCIANKYAWILPIPVCFSVIALDHLVSVSCLAPAPGWQETGLETYWAAIYCLQCTAMYCSKLQLNVCTALYSLHCTALHWISLSCTVMYSANCTALHYSTLPFTLRTVLQRTAIYSENCPALHQTTMHCSLIVILQCIELNCGPYSLTLLWQ